MVFNEFYNLQVVKPNENKHGEKFSLLELLGCDRKELRKHDLIVFIILHVMYGQWIENSLLAHLLSLTTCVFLALQHCRSALI